MQRVECLPTPSSRDRPAGGLAGVNPGGRHGWLICLALAISAPAWAEAPVLGMPDEVTGVRSAGMGDATRSLSSGNDCILLNPAATAASSRYEVDAQGALDLGQLGGFYGASILDSTTGPVAAGLAFDRAILGPVGSRTVANLFDLAIGAALGPNVALGASAKLIHGAFLEKSNAGTMDVGVMAHFEYFAAAFTGTDLINVGSANAPRQFALAASGGPDIVKGAIDLIGDYNAPTPKYAVHGGVEVTPLSWLSVRGGGADDLIENTQWLTLGSGVFIDGAGVGVDAAFRYQLNGPERELLVGLKLVIPEIPDTSEPAPSSSS